MPYSNWKRHNSPVSINSISNPYHSLSQLWSYLPSQSPRKFQWVESLPSERRILNKREEWLKIKRGETSVEKPHVSRKEQKERMKFTCCWERLYQKKERNEIIISYSVKSDVWPYPYPQIICICTTFYSLTFPFLTPIHYTILHQPWLFATQTL
jgi:hypothetical protein